MEESYENIYNQLQSEVDRYQNCVDKIFAYIEAHPNVQELEDIFQIIKECQC